MKILIVSRSIFSNNPQSIRFRSFIELWKEQNEVSLLTFDANIPQSIPDSLKGLNIYRSKKNKLSKLITQSLILSKGKKTGNKSGIIKRFITKLNYRKLFFPDVYVFTINDLKNKIKRLINSNSYEIIIVSAFPFSFQMLGRFIKRNYSNNIIIVYDTGDPFYGNSSKTTQGILHKFFSYYYEKIALKSYDYIVVPSIIMKNFYIDNFLIEESRIVVIAQGVEISEIELQTKSNSKSEGGIIKLMYAGKFYKGLREPFEFYKAIDKSAQYKVDIFGNISTFFSSLSENIFFHGEKDNQYILQQYFNTDIIVFIDNASGFQVPGKVYEVLAFKKPILFIYSNDQSPTLRIVEHLEFVFTVPNDSNLIQHKLKEIEKKKDTIKYDFQINDFTWKSLANEYLKSINEKI